MKEEKLKRDEKIRKAAEISYAKAVTPGPLKRAIERKKKAMEQPPKQEEYSFKPKLGPDFSKEKADAKYAKFIEKMTKST
jgi:hypothetical protein